MVPLLIDENFNHRILRGLRRRLPTLEYLLVQETEVSQKGDPEVLDWAAAQNRVILTHDVNTMTQHAHERLKAGRHLSGLVIVPKDLAIGAGIEELFVLLTCSTPEEFPNQIVHLPL
jgi:hypothetical protein